MLKTCNQDKQNFNETLQKNQNLCENNDGTKMLIFKSRQINVIQKALVMSIDLWWLCRRWMQK